MVTTGELLSVIVPSPARCSGWPASRRRWWPCRVNHRDVVVLVEGDGQRVAVTDADLVLGPPMLSWSRAQGRWSRGRCCSSGWGPSSLSLDLRHVTHSPIPSELLVTLTRFWTPAVASPLVCPDHVRHVVLEGDLNGGGRRDKDYLPVIGGVLHERGGNSGQSRRQIDDANRPSPD